jgi:hypothetical protein
MSRLTQLSDTVGDYLRFYGDYAAQRWNHLTPMEYGIILISVGVLGWVLMKNASRR